MNFPHIFSIVIILYGNIQDYMNHKGIPLAERAIISEDSSSIDYGSQSYRLKTGAIKSPSGV